KDDELTKDDLKVGDKIILDAGSRVGHYPLRGTCNGDVYTITDLNPCHEDGEIEIEGAEAFSGKAYPKLNQIKLAEKTTQRKLKNGDKVKVVAENPGYGWGSVEKGEVGTVTNV